MVDLIKRLSPLLNGKNNGWREPRIRGNSGKAKVNQQWPGVSIIGYVFTNKNKTFIFIVYVCKYIQVYIDKEDIVISIKVVLIIESIIYTFIESAKRNNVQRCRMEIAENISIHKLDVSCVLDLALWIHILSTISIYLFFLVSYTGEHFIYIIISTSRRMYMRYSADVLELSFFQMTWWSWLKRMLHQV